MLLAANQIRINNSYLNLIITFFTSIFILGNNLLRSERKCPPDKKIILWGKRPSKTLYFLGKSEGRFLKIPHFSYFSLFFYHFYYFSGISYTNFDRETLSGPDTWACLTRVYDFAILSRISMALSFLSYFPSVSQA